METVEKVENIKNVPVRHDSSSNYELRRRFFAEKPQHTQKLIQDIDNEPPLLEELGLDLEDIVRKTFEASLNENKDQKLLKETDISGPFLLCLAMGILMLLQGRMYFGYIYGLGCLSCIAMYLLLNLMSVYEVTLGCTITVLGYCLLPIVLLCFISLLFPLKGVCGLFMSGSAVWWSAKSSSKLFLTVLKLDECEQALIAYPCGLFYSSFALIIMF